MTTPSLPEAAQALIDRWDTPMWKDVPATGEFINALRSALAADRAATAPDERAAFEAWADSMNYAIHRDETDKYKDYHRATTRFAREGWLSALAWYTRLTAPDRAANSNCTNSSDGCATNPDADGMVTFDGPGAFAVLEEAQREMDRAAADQGKEAPVSFPSDTGLLKDAAPDRAANSLAAPDPDLIARLKQMRGPFLGDGFTTVTTFELLAALAPSVPPVGVGRESWDHPVNFTWEPCNPGCDAELNGCKSRHCDCEPAKARIAWLRAAHGSVDSVERLSQTPAGLGRITGQDEFDAWRQS